MKKIYLLVCMMTCLALSCSNDNEGLYSCNQTTNAWVKNHLNEIQMLTRAEWQNCDSNLQTPIYRAFTKEQKVAFWNDKIAEVKRLNWSKEEIKHISLVETFIASHTEFFDGHKLSEEEEDELDLFFYQWMKTAIDELGWDKQVVYGIVCSGYSLKDTKGTLDVGQSHTLVSSVEKLTSSSEGSTLPECNCKKDHILACSINAGECKDECNETSIGCGWLYAQPCTGKCSIL